MGKNDLVLGGIAFGPRPNVPAVKGIAPRRRRGPDYPISRDYAMPIVKCGVTECPAHRGGMCTMLSCISIRADGKCDLGMKSREKEAGNAGRAPR